MRVLIVHPHLFVKGGGERLTSILAKGLVKPGYEISIITKSVEDGFSDLNGLRIFPIKEIISQGEFLPERIISLGLSLRRAIREIKPDFIISMTEDILNLGLSKLIRRQVKTIQYIHFPREEEREETGNKGLYKKYFRFPEWLNRSFLWAVDYMLCNSNYTKEAIKRVWGKEAQVVYPPLSPIFMEKPDNLRKVRENIILSVGRFTPLKRQDFLIKIFKEEIRKEVHDAKLVMAGFIDKRFDKYFEQIKSYQSEEIKFYINPTDEELLNLYRRAKIFCHPRIGEHFGLSPIEAMSQGVPVVGYGSGGLVEAVAHKESGFLANNDREFLNYIKYVLKMDNKAWFQLQSRACEKARFFSPERFIEEVKKCLVR
jgi:glycosyltransferase involved in cell wall biosynthesis